MNTITRSRTVVSTKTAVLFAAIGAGLAAVGFLKMQFDNSNTVIQPPIVQTQLEREFATGDVIIELSEGVSADIIKSSNDDGGDEALRQVYQKFGQPKVQAVFPQTVNVQNWDQREQHVKQKFEQRSKRSSVTTLPQLDRFYVLHFDVDDDALAAVLTELQTSHNVVSVSYNYHYQADAAFPNDPYAASAHTWLQPYKDLWGLYKTSATRAWSAGYQGNSNVIVAVIDTGLDLTHRDIVDNLYSNSTEIAGNGIDDDANGYIDDKTGWDFVNNDADPTDDYHHGTHVAGTIAATGNNAIGITGMMWDAQILPVKVLDATSSGTAANIAAGIIYAADQGADVINLSLGGSDSTAMAAAVQYAYNLGVVVVVSAGNDSTDAMSQAPASYDEVITVGSSSPLDRLSSFSNFGSKLDVVAPGEDILSLLAAGAIDYDTTKTLGRRYYRDSGTSMATPQVAGAVGLLLASNPSYSVEEVRQAIRRADDIDAAGWDTTTGYGRLNVLKAAQNPKLCEAYITNPDQGGVINPNLVVSGYAGGTDFGHYDVKVFSVSDSTRTLVTSSGSLATAVSSGTLATLTIPDYVSGANYSITVTVTDALGRTCGSDRKEVTSGYELGTYASSNYLKDFAYSDGYIYAAAYQGGLEVIDVSTLASPTLVGTYSNGVFHSTDDVAVQDQYAYIVNSSGGLGLQVLDISTPSSPTRIGGYGITNANDLSLSGQYAYVAAGDAGLDIIDISTPTSPTLVANLDTPGRAFALTVVGNYAYVADYTAGLQIIDISTPSSPVLVGAYSTPNYLYDVEVKGDYAYLVDTSSFLMEVIDISVPSSPTLRGTYDANTSGLSNNFGYAGDYLYLLTRAGLNVVHVADVGLPYLAATYAYDFTSYGNMLVQDDLAYIADSHSMHIISLTAELPAQAAVVVGQYDTTGLAYDVAVAGDYAYVADHTAGLQTIDISTPLNPTVTSTNSTSGSAVSVAVDAGYAYVADSYNSLDIFSLSTPSSPVLVGTYNMSGIRDVKVIGHYAYLAATSSGLVIIDISTPSSPTLVGSLTTSAAEAVSIDGSYAYVADYEGGLVIIDISTPSSPTLVGSLTTSAAEAVSIDGSYAYVATSADGLNVIDISTPSSPVLVGNYPTTSYVEDVIVADGLAYIADGYNGLAVLDISIPASPTLYAVGSNTGFALGLDKVGDYIYMADWSAGLKIITVVAA